MKLVTYERAGSGEVRHGRLDGDTIADLGSGDLQAIVTAGAATAETGETVPAADVRLRAPLLRPGKLLAAAANYQDHVTESGGQPLDRSRLSPRLFLKPPTGIAGPGDQVALPDLTKEMDWEAELGVVIGQRCRDVPAEDALGVVFGYLAANDVSARSLDLSFERDTDDRAVWFFDWLAGKWFDGFAPMGPWLVTADEVPDPQALDIRFELNGETRQHASSKDMIFTTAELIAWASRLMTLEPGDIILTGTPAGVGAATGTFLKPGDEMRVTIEKLGTLVNHVA
ncbi:fumarylacetoacetate hydrolase family protein [Flindersiella endophytica]